MRRLAWSLLFLVPVAAEAGSWPQFKGPHGSGLQDSAHPLPAKIGPDENMLWKTALPPGHSGPVVFGDRVYVTAARDKALLTIALERATGKILWEREAPLKGLEKIHKVGSYAQATPATDGECVVSLFGSSGLLCYNPDGKLLWHLPLGPFKNDFGTGSSPLLVGERVILNQDHDTDSFLTALDKRTGKPLWKTDRSEFPRSYATPVIWEANGKKQIVVAGTLRLVAYDFDTGKEVWTVYGLSRIVNMTPTVGGDGNLYVAAWSPGGDEGDRIKLLSLEDMMAKHDTDKNGSLEPDEVPPGPVKERFTQIDRDKDGHITRLEYTKVLRIFEEARNVMLAIKPGGTGDISKTHVIWETQKVLPYVPSPLSYNGLLFMVKNGGIVNCLDARTGQPTKQERVPASGNYYSSPVGGDGKVYLISERGDLSVISAEPQWRVLSRGRFGEDVYATPAIADGHIFVRTAGHLYCFGEKAK